MKESYPVNTMEHAIKHNIPEEPAFAWWVPFVKRKSTAIISKASTIYWDLTHKYGIKIPKNVKDVLRIDKERNNTLWQDVIILEMKNVHIVF